MTGRRPWILALTGLLLLCLAGPLRTAGAQDDVTRQFLELDLGDRQQTQGQRERAEELFRRYIGPPVRGNTDDLRALQELLDQEVLDSGDTFDLQSLGVVLGDVMVHELPLQWTIVVDEYGRSRGLRYRDTELVFFPVTMISRRVERDAPVDIRALYDKVAELVAGREKQRERKR